MRIPRFYQSQPLQPGQTIELSAENFRHAVQVMRLKVGSPIILFNGEGGECKAELVDIGKRQASAHLQKVDAVDRESPLHTTLVIALIKPDKMDFALQKAVEMGVTQIQPVITERSVIRIKASRMDKKIQHWQGVVISACEQSGRTSIPQILPELELAEYLQQSSNALRIVMLPNARQRINELDAPVASVELLIGPEGGYTAEEEQLLSLSGIRAITFGSRIMRAETAVVAGLTALQQAWGDC